MSKKILILSASPIRDRVVDELMAEKLLVMENEVKIVPMLRAGRDTVLDYKPDVCVVPPIRNVYARDFAEQLKKWKVGVITRHTEPSCDWQDFKAMTPKQKHSIWGPFPYIVDKELVWSEDEAQILNRRVVDFETYAIGATTCDVYYRPDIIKKFQNRKKFNQTYKFSDKKKNLMIASPWGFADSAPDLQIDETVAAQKDEEGFNRHIAMIKKVHKALKNKWNILLSIHPGVIVEPYKKLSQELHIPLDARSTSFNLLVNLDALIHAGSTMAINVDLLKYPAYPILLS